jgi:eukaryotic-like serine/threonine-protein kinase
MKCSACSRDADPSDVWCTSCGRRVAPADGPPVEKTAPGEPAALAFDPAVKTDPSSGPLMSDPPKPKPLAAGTIIDKKYEILRVLGEGGMGIVYLAEDANTGIRVVLKAIRPELSHRKDVRERTLAEGRTLARIDHPNVVYLNAVVADESGLWLVMQYIEGESLDKTIKRYRASGDGGADHFVSFTVALDIFRQILEGVAAAHREGVIHRDLKPANVLVRKKDGVAKVTDFGIAKPEEQARVGQGNTKGVIGSLWYMSPEQVQGRRDLDKRLDIYALGILLYELLTGSVPFNAESSYEIMRQHVEAPLPKVKEKRRDVPAWVDRVLARACAKKRDDRYASCEEFMADLDRELGGPMRPVAGATRVLSAYPPPEKTMDDEGRDRVDAPAGRPKPREASVAPKPAPKTTEKSPDEKEPSAPQPSKAKTQLPEPDGEGSPRGDRVVRGRRWLVLGVLLALAAVSGGAYLALRDPKPSRAKREAAPSSAPPATSEPAPEPSSTAGATVTPTADPLDGLVGSWRSEKGTDFEAVRVGARVEFRVVDPSQLAPADYAAGEPRFILRATDAADTFSVEETMRPHFAEPFDPKARTTCQEIWTEVDGRPLLATTDGSSLRVDFARASFDPKMAVVEHGKVVGCNKLRGAVGGRARTTLTRVTR